MRTSFDLQNIENILLAAVLVCKVSNKDRSVTEAMTKDDVDLVSRAQYIAIQTIKNRETEGYGQHEVSF
jgi:homoserine kinase